MFSQKFFIQRSFEVVWAVFRVAEHTTRPKIKQGLEDKATDYLLAKDSHSLDELEQVIRLSAQIKEISQVNTGVLLREIGNLQAAMMEFADSQRKCLEPAKTPENAPRIEETFSRPPMLVSDLIEALKTGYRGQGIGDSKEEFRVEGIANNRKEEGVKSPATPQQDRGKESSNPSASSGQGVRPSFAQEGLRTGKQESGKSPARNEKSPARKTDRFEAVVGFKERNDAIMEILSKRNLCHIKDLATALPNVSERTIRYDIQRMADKGIIERVGSGGPSSFFRLKKS